MLRLERNSIGADGPNALAKALQVTEKVAEGSRGEATIRQKRMLYLIAVWFSDACSQLNRTLRELKLYGNAIGSAGAKALAVALQVRSARVGISRRVEVESQRESGLAKSLDAFSRDSSAMLWRVVLAGSTTTRFKS